MQFIENFFFEPIKCQVYRDKKIIKVENNFAYCDIADNSGITQNRCLLIARDNYGNLDQLQTRKQLDFIRQLYPQYDVYMCEYFGFGMIKGSPSIENCILTLSFWLQYLKSKYTNVDCMGIGLGGGLLIETLYRNKIFITDLYVMSAFTKFIDVVKTISSCGHGFLKTIPKYNDLFNNIDHISELNVERVYIIHSKLDTIVSYNHGLDLYAKVTADGKITQVQFIEIDGDHKCPKILIDSVTN